MLRSYVVAKQFHWEDKPSFVECTYNSNKHLAVCMMPFKMMYGYQLLIPLEIDLKNFKGKIEVSLEMLQQI